jgi:hypothetical protein
VLLIVKGMDEQGNVGASLMPAMAEDTTVIEKSPWIESLADTIFGPSS